MFFGGFVAVSDITVYLHFWFIHQSYVFLRAIPMRTVPVTRNRKICLGPGFPAIYNFESIQFSDTLMLDGYFHIFLKDESN